MMDMCIQLSIFIINIIIINCAITSISYNHNKKFNDWNITEWWSQNRDFDDRINDIEFDNKMGMSSKFSYKSIDQAKKDRPDYYMPSNSSDLIDYLESYDGIDFVIPRSSVRSIKKTLKKYFNTPRSHKRSDYNYIQIKKNLRKEFYDLGLNTGLQTFWPPELTRNFYDVKTHNILGVWPGIYRGTVNDEIVIIGAHYDTVRPSPGVDDNGSGSTAVIEIAKMITQSNCKLNKTLIFALFDMEEDGLKGSKHFVKEYLIPIEMKKNRAKVFGAFIMDMILEYDNNINSQSHGPFYSLLPEWSQNLTLNGNRADFCAIWARKGVDTKLYEHLNKNWINRDKYKLSLMSPIMPEFGSDVDMRYRRFRKYDTFIRSDHASFWYPTDKDITINAILITDLGPWRSSMRHHYHKASDDNRLISNYNLGFLKNTIDSIINTLITISNGHCQI